MDRRLKLHQILKSIPEVAKVYFQPPPEDKMEYPCIIYTEDDNDPDYADNIPYRLTKKYQVMVIDERPDSKIPDAVALLPTSRWNKRYVADNLNHTVYNLFF